jgi:glycerol-3-phosphate dehydrogenase
MTNRDAMLERATRQSADGPYDLLIIGGGITGAGAARDAARRGLSVCVVEQDDLASGTSSRSSKLVHGGLRYLETYEFSLVFEAVTERRVLMDIAPHLVNPLGFLFPVFKDSRRGVFTIKLGMWVYDGLSLFRSPRIHRHLSRKAVAKEEPALRQDKLSGAPLYYDCSTDDARLTLETVLDAAIHGAAILSHTRVVSLLRSAEGHVAGARVRDVLTGDERDIHAHAVINATGPWSDRTRALGKGQSPRLRPTKGIHLVVDAERLPITNAVVCMHPSDGRVLFAIPWGDRSYVGTTDTDFEGDPANVQATADDVHYLLEAANHFFPDSKLTTDDVFSTWAGVRPLISEETAGKESSVSREHAIEVDEDLLITIAGGKLTTYRRMGAEVVDKALGVLMLRGMAPDDLRPARTDREPLPGAVGWPENDDHALVADMVKKAGNGRISDATARNLANNYGTRGVDVAETAANEQLLASALIPGRPEIMAQVDHAVHHELAATVRDVLIRRTQIFFRDHDQGLGCCEAVANRMAELLGWDGDREVEEVLGYQREVALARRWREDLKP